MASTSNLVQYSINKSKVMLGFVGSQWEQHIVAELDSAMNKWVDSVPDHCKLFATLFDLHLSSGLVSAMGPQSRERSVAKPVSVSVCNILPPPNYRSSTLHPIASETFTTLVPVPRDLHECSPGLYPCPGRGQRADRATSV